MSGSVTSNVPSSELVDLVEILWNWRVCAGCEDRDSCVHGHCSPWRFHRLKAFFRTYECLIEQNMIGVKQRPAVALNSREEFLELLTALKNRQTASQDQIAADFFGDASRQPAAALTEQRRAIKLAARVLLMINCSASNDHLGDLESGYVQGGWKGDQTLEQFLRPSVFAEGEVMTIREPNELLNANNLQRKAHLTLKPTSNMRRHLYLDRKNWTVEVYPHLSFLREYVMASTPTHSGTPAKPLPRQLALEVLDSFQKVLFPLEDVRSYQILQDFVDRKEFDADCKHFESKTIGRDSDEDYVEFQYLGTRLSILTDEIRNPRPYSPLHRWLQGISGERYVMLATLIGVIVAVLLGLLALILSAFQTYVSWQAWKHPVSPPASIQNSV